MATLTVWKFKTAEGAEQAEGVLLGLAKQELITINDAAVVTWPLGRTKPKTRQLVGLGGAGALGGAFWGMLFGLLFFVPLLGMAVGAATGALAGKLSDVGISDDFIESLRSQIQPGTSALFVLSSDAVIDRVSDAFAGSELLYTNLSAEEEERLRAVFGEED